MSPEVQSVGCASHVSRDTAVEQDVLKENPKVGETDESSVRKARDADNLGEVQIVEVKEADPADHFRYLYSK